MKEYVTISKEEYERLVQFSTSAKNKVKSNATGKTLTKQVVENSMVYDETSPSKLTYKSGGYVPTNLNKGGYVRLYVRGYGNSTAHRVIAALKYGSISPKDVIDHVDGDRTNNSMDNLRKVCAKINSRNRSFRSDNTSGVRGVHYSSTQNAWVADWRDHITLKLHHKSFACKKYGSEVAFELAKDFRENIMEHMNNKGAGYTTRHIKQSQ